MRASCNVFCSLAFFVHCVVSKLFHWEDPPPFPFFRLPVWSKAVVYSAPRSIRIGIHTLCVHSENNIMLITFS